MERLTKIFCDGCGRAPTFWEWVRGELTNEGYPEWRHPGIAFRAAGCPLGVERREKCERVFLALFGRALPDDPSYLCPQCQERAEQELPALVATDLEPERRTPSRPRHYLGE